VWVALRFTAPEARIGERGVPTRPRMSRQVSGIVGSWNLKSTGCVQLSISTEAAFNKAVSESCTLMAIF
jgi:hypothetical protein